MLLVVSFYAKLLKMTGLEIRRKKTVHENTKSKIIFKTLFNHFLIKYDKIFRQLPF